MALSIKSKIAIGIGILFTLLVTISIVAIVFINLLSVETENLLTANYNTIMYCSEMNNALYDLDKIPGAKDSFETYLKYQEHNITEPGEYETTLQLRNYFEQIKKNGYDTNLVHKINKTIYKIYCINQGSLHLKNKSAIKIAADAKIWLTCLATTLVLLSFSFIINFPGYIANPVKLLTEGIKEIGQKNYEKRIYLDSNDEFGEMANAFNTMAKRLYDYDHSNLSQLMFEKKRIETIVNQMPDAVICLDADNKILFINHNAELLFNLNEAEIVGKLAPEVARYNDLLGTILKKNEPMPILKIVLQGQENAYVVDFKTVANDGVSLGAFITLRNVTAFKQTDSTKTA